MQRDDATGAVDQHKKVALRDLRNVLRRILDGQGVGSAHDGPCERKVGQQGYVIRQHRFAFMTEVLKGGHGIAQIDGDALSSVGANAPLYEK